MEATMADCFAGPAGPDFEEERHHFAMAPGVRSAHLLYADEESLATWASEDAEVKREVARLLALFSVKRGTSGKSCADSMCGGT